MNWSNNPLFNPFTLFGLLVIAYACVVQLVNAAWFGYPAYVGFPLAVALAIMTHQRMKL